MKKLIGYIVMSPTGPMKLTMPPRGTDGKPILGSAQVATLFKTLAEARAASNRTKNYAADFKMKNTVWFQHDFIPVADPNWSASLAVNGRKAPNRQPAVMA